MAALPLQGLAAVSMMLCGGPAAAAEAAGGGLHHGVHADHEAHAAGHDGHAHGDALDHDAAAVDTASADAGHDCGICGAGCHSVAIASTVDPMGVSDAPQPPLAAAAPAIHTRIAPLPDRPPRA